MVIINQLNARLIMRAKNLIIKILSLVCLLYIISGNKIFAQLQCFDYEWAISKDFTSAGGYDIIGDAEGNTYVTGSIQPGSTSFGSKVITAPTGFHGSGSPIFMYVAKYNNLGECLWVKTISKSPEQAMGAPDAPHYHFSYGKKLQVDEDGNVYVLGTLDGEANFGTTTLTSWPFWSESTINTFVAKLNSNGDWIWAKTVDRDIVELEGPIYTKSMVIDSNNNIYFTVIGSNINGGNGDILIKLYSNGQYAWSYDENVPSNFVNYSAMEIDLTGNVYLAGSYYGNVIIGGTSMSSNTGESAFIGKMSPIGTWMWAKNVTNGTYGGAFINQLKLYNQNELVISGRKTGLVSLGVIPITSDGGFRAKMDISGNFQIVDQSALPFSYLWGQFVSDSDGNYYISGGMNPNDTVYFGTLSLHNNTTEYLHFLAKSQAFGQWEWAKLIHGKMYSADSFDNFYASDNYSSDIQIGPHSLVTTSNNPKTYLTKISPVVIPINYTISLSNDTLFSHHLTGIYQWMDCENDTIISGETNFFFVPKVNGSYKVLLADCGTSGVTPCLDVNTLETKNMENFESLNVYPNPVTDFLNIEWTNSNLKQLIISDIHGRILLDKSFTENLTSIDTKSFSSGIYLISIETEKGNIIKRFVKN